MRKENGYSLFELLGVVMIVGIVVAVAAPNLVKANRNYRLISTARDIAQAFQSAKFDAVAANTHKSVTINTNNNTVTLSNGRQVVLPADVHFANLSGSAPNSIAIACKNSGSVSGQKGNNKLAVSFPEADTAGCYEAEFTSKGLPDVDPGVVNWIYLTNNDGEKVAITITSAGSTEVLKYRNGQWVK